MQTSSVSGVTVRKWGGGRARPGGHCQKLLKQLLLVGPSPPRRGCPVPCLGRAGGVPSAWPPAFWEAGARRGRPTGWWPGWWPAGEAACGRFSCRPAACPVFCPSPFVRPPGVSALLVAPSPLHTCLAHTADSRFPSFAKLDTSPLAFLSVRS